jgi:hypothetical protein
MAKITETQTETETKKVEQTTTIEKIKCDICAHVYEEDEWNGREFSVDPDIDRRVHSIYELKELFDAYHIDIPRHVIDDGYNGHEMNFDVPKREFFDVLNEEMPIARDRQEKSTNEQLSMAALREDYADKLGTHNFYIKDDVIHHFMYEINIEASTEDHKHVCDDCYGVIFD